MICFGQLQRREAVARKHLLIPCLLIILTLLGAGSAVSGAELMVGPGTIAADSFLAPGRAYTLPVHEVTNNSIHALEVTVSVSEHRDETRELPPAEWFSIDREELIVQARSTEKVQVEVNLPEDTPSGKYQVWFLFDAMPTSAGGMITAAAIQVSFTFEVKDTDQSALPAKNVPFGKSAGEVTPFLWAGAAAVLLATLGLGVRFAYRRRKG